ncbi:MAG: hypothetical protein RLZZ480_729 [Candidatus Parcubacteria bacterium]|jgi:hypothetical protein
MFYPTGETVKYYLTHPDKEMFFLDVGANVATAARYIMIRGFKYIHQDTDIHTDGYKSFEQDGIEYHLVMFDGPVVAEAGVDGYQKLKEDGFDFVMIGDHPLAPKIVKAMGR